MRTFRDEICIALVALAAAFLLAVCYIPTMA